MSTKYAKARDVAYQWRSECRKLQRENQSLRQVLKSSKLLLHTLEQIPITPRVEHHLTIKQLARDILNVELYE